MKKIFLVSLSLVLVAAMVVGGTLAYLTVDGQKKSNVVTVGDISILLDEEVGVEGAGKVVETDAGATYSGVMPGDVLKKEVTVTNTGTHAAYVRVDVNLNNVLAINKAIDEVYEKAPYNYSEEQIQAIYDEVFEGWGLNYTKKNAEYDSLGMRLTITGDDMPEHVMQVDSVKTITDYTNAYVGNWNESSAEILKNGKFHGYYSQNMGKYELRYAYYILLEAGESTTLFNGFNVPAEFNKAQLAMFDNFKVDVTASAIQADNMPSLENYGSEAHAKVAFAILAGDTYPSLDAWEDEADTSWYDKDETVFVIDSAEKLAGLSQLVYGGNNFSGKTIKLEANINLGNKAWTPIGRMINTSGVAENSTFKGTFDGQGYTVYNLNVNTVDGVSDTNKGAGLFGAVTGSIKNLTVKNAKVETAHWAGVIAGSIEGSISNCHVENATLVCFPEYIGEWDNGDKAGAIVGYATKGTISDCTAKDVSIIAYRDIGAIAGASYNSVVNCSVSNVTITKDNTHDYKGTADDTTVNSYVGSIYNGAAVEATGDVVINMNAYRASNNTEFDEAIKSGADTIILDDGNYVVPDTAQGKTLTIIGNGDTVIATQDDGSYEGCDYSLDGSTVTFENVVINTDSHTYTGYARCKATYNNCTINGTFTLYDESEFNNCTFNVSGDVYNIWTWGATTATFNDCVFNSDGKAMLLYGTTDTNLTINDCVFNDNGGLTDLKAAIEIGNDYGKSYKLVVNNTVVNGYEINDKGINTGTTLWANKNSMGTDKLNVIVDGVDVY